MVGHGPKGSCPSGSLPVFSVENEEEASRLITLACPTNYSGQHIAVELAAEQTMANLAAFSRRLKDLYERFIVDKPLRL